MKIHTNTKELRQARRDIVELILDNHPEDCHTCERDGNCELQRLAYSMGIRKRHFKGEKKHYDKDLSSEAVIRDPNKCILCGRCVRMCSEIQQVHNLTQAHRGFQDGGDAGVRYALQRKRLHRVRPVHQCLSDGGISGKELHAGIV